MTQHAWDRSILIDTMSQQAKALHCDFETFAVQKREQISAIVAKLRSVKIPIGTTLAVSEIFVEKLLEPDSFLARSELLYVPSLYLEAFSRGREKYQQIAAISYKNR